MVFNSLVVAALAPVLRGQSGRNAGDNDDTTRHLLGRSVRVVAFGLAFVISASLMTTRERATGEFRLLEQCNGRKAHTVCAKPELTCCVS